MLEVKDLTVRYGAIEALSGVSVSAQNGFITAILGANGAGKSSLLRAISGISPVVGGTIILDGKDITRMSAIQRSRLGIAQAMEGRRLFRQLTVDENLRLAWHFGRRAAPVQRAIAEVHERFPILREKSKIPAGLLSGGQQQMLILSCATIRAPRVLLLDEPSLGLSPLITAQIYQFIMDYAKSAQVAVFLSEQMAAVALRASTEVCVLRRGKAVLLSKSKDLLEKGMTSELSEMYL